MSAKTRGFIPFAPLLIIIFILLALIPVFLAGLFPAFKVLMLAYFCIVIFLFVRNILGSGILAYAVAAILIYIFVIRLWPLFAASYMLFLIVSFGLTSFLFFSLQR